MIFNKKRRLIFLLGVICISLIFNFIPFNVNVSNFTEEEIDDFNSPATSGFWSVDYIHIKNDNWSVSGDPWIQVNAGTQNSPHIIENVTIDAGGTGYGFFIEGCKEYFIINNCTALNTEQTFTANYDYGGLIVFNTTNGQITHNNFSFNGYHGLVIEDCSNIAISNNFAHNNTERGFSIDDSTRISFTENTAYFNDIGLRIDDMSYSNFTGNTVYNNTFDQYSDGVHFADDCIFINFSENIIFNNSGDGIEVEDRSNNNTISNNEIYNNGDNGIEIDDSCINNAIFGNDIYDNSGDGLYVFYSSYNSIFDNEIFNNTGTGVYLNISDNNLVYDNLVRSNDMWGIMIEHSSNISIKENLIEDSTKHGIRLYYCNDTKLLFNDVNNNSLNGVELYYSNNNTISGNNVNFNLGRGYEIRESFGNVVSDNIISNHQDYGILLSYSEHNEIDENIFVDNDYGIGLSDYSHSNSIRENKINGSLNAGIDIYLSNYLIVFNNVVNNNTGNGILFEESANNNVSRNLIMDNTITGIYTDSLTLNTLIWENFFFRNGKHAVDDGSNNNWNSTIIGNYWDNWTSPDVNPNDGIVDAPYTYIGGSAESIDYLPMAEDGAPRITINSPNSGDGFGIIAPSFDVEITDIYVISRWYTIDGGLNNITFTENGIINQSAWDALADGTTTLKFYASDIIGYIGSAEVSIIKDTVAPVIIINSPAEGERFGKNAPLFNITVTEINLDVLWYSFDGGAHIYVITNNTVFNQTAWTELAQGDVTITFYALDIAGNEASESVTVIKSVPSGLDPGMIITIVIVSVVGGVAIISVVYIFMKKRTTP